MTDKTTQSRTRTGTNRNKAGKNIDVGPSEQTVTFGKVQVVGESEKAIAWEGETYFSALGYGDLS